VTLKGTVDERRTKRMAEDVVEGCSGVRDVMNQLRVRQGSDWSDQGSQDRSSRSGSNDEDRASRSGSSDSGTSSGAKESSRSSNGSQHRDRSNERETANQR
jgi:hypothetical protein